MVTRVLLIGDSIRSHYQAEVARQLGEEYEVMGPEDNCRFSSFVLNSLRFWLAECPNPDIIHWNAGLWDTAILYHEDGCFIGIEEYVENMKKIQRELVKTGAVVIFATTTPVSDDKKYFPGPMPPAHDSVDIVRYNEAVLKAFREEGVIVNDLFSLINPKKDEYLKADKIHPNEEGIKLLGKAVADVIRQQSENVKPKETVPNHGMEYVRPEEKLIQ